MAFPEPFDRLDVLDVPYYKFQNHGPALFEEMNIALQIIIALVPMQAGGDLGGKGDRGEFG